MAIGRSIPHGSRHGAQPVYAVNTIPGTFYVTLRVEKPGMNDMEVKRKEEWLRQYNHIAIYDCSKDARKMPNFLAQVI